MPYHALSLGFRSAPLRKRPPRRSETAVSGEVEAAHAVGVARGLLVLRAQQLLGLGVPAKDHHVLRVQRDGNAVAGVTLT